MNLRYATSDNEKIYTPESLGFSRYRDIDLDGGQTPKEAAKIFDNIMNNTATEAQKNVVVVNSAFAIHVICPERLLRMYHSCKRITRKRKGTEYIKKFIELNN